MRKNNVKLLIITLVVYLVLLYISIVTKLYILTIVLKPCATLFAYISLVSIIHVTGEYKKIKNLISAALLCGFIINFINMTGDIIGITQGYDLIQFHNIIFGLYLISRLLIFVLAIEIYYIISLNLNRHMILSDIFTILSCCGITIWIYFRGKTSMVTDENTLLLMRLDIITIFRMIFMIISLGIISLLLLSWFQLKNTAMVIGQKMIMLGITGISGTDLFQVMFMDRIKGSIYTILFYNISILCIAAGGILLKFHPLDLLNRNSGRKIFYASWQNVIYFLLFPFLNILAIGFYRVELMYILVFAYYCVSCRYVKQIAITDELLEAEKIMNEKLKIYSNIIEQTPLSIVIEDLNGKIQYVNPQYTKDYGYTNNEIYGKNNLVMKPEHIAIEFYKEIEQKIKNGEKWNGELVNVNRNRDEVEERAIILPIKNEQNQIINYVMIMHNISETKKIQNQLSDQNYFTSQLLDAMPCAIYYTDISGAFLGANKECKKEYGYLGNQNTLDGERLSDQSWMDKDSNRRVEQMREETLRTNRPSIRQITRKLEAGRIIETLYSVTAFYRADGSVGGFLGVMTDVTDLKQKEKELEEALRHANEAAEAKTQFLANMSHEIRTPMNAIIGILYLVLKTDLNPKQADYITKIHNASTSLLGIINDILDFSKIESGKMEIELVEFNLDKVITDSIGLFVQKAYEKNLEFIYHFPSGIPSKLYGDPLRLGQIMNNLVSNAVKFTQQGEIVVDVCMEDKTEDKVLLKISVRDTGIGISERNRDKLFEAFTQSDSSTTRKYGGTGLGLAISRNLIELMRGTLSYESEYTKGSTFYFCLWFDYEEDNHSDFFELPESFKNMKVLVADDNYQVRIVLQEYLSAMGFQVELAKSGEEALEKIIQNGKEQYQIVFLDRKMNEMSGIQTANEIRKRKEFYFKPSIILMTEQDVDEIMKSDGHINVEGFLNKPIGKTALYNTIADLFALNVDKTLEKSKTGELTYKLSGVNVLLAEDNQINQQIVVELLTFHGIHVDVVNNGLEAVRKIRSIPTDNRYDIVLMDLQMPVMDGFEAAKHIHEMENNIPVIALSARTMTEEKEKCFEAGMVDHIAKPIDPVNLLATIMKWVDSANPKLKKEIYHESIDSEEYDLTIKGIDTKAGLKRVSNKLDLYINLLYCFTEELTDMTNQMRKAFKADDVISVGKLAHSLKGVAGNVGADKIQNVSNKMEKLSKQGALKEEILLLYFNLCDEANEVIQSINQTLKTDLKEIEKM